METLADFDQLGGLDANGSDGEYADGSKLASATNNHPGARLALLFVLDGAR
jgi:hypothetical protein